jgi:ClpX C4-type zinc finger
VAGAAAGALSDFHRHQRLRRRHEARRPMSVEAQACSFCGASVHRRGRAIAGPYVSMCKDCISATLLLLEGKEMTDPLRKSLFALNPTVLHCAFCGRGPGEYAALISSKVGRGICETCLDSGAMLGRPSIAGP